MNMTRDEILAMPAGREVDVLVGIYILKLCVLKRLEALPNMDSLSIPAAMLNDMMSNLTPRQLEIVVLLAQGRSNKEIAFMLSISWDTVKSHIRTACQRTNLENKMQLGVAFALWKQMNKESK